MGDSVVKVQEILGAKYKIDIDLSSLERVKMTDWVAEIKADGIKEGRNRNPPRLSSFSWIDMVRTSIMHSTS